ncbi:Putative epoxide hydrolase OS=Stigmatella aurantiaca (strain DW4/3-1) GN=STAUR_4299 PE=3 SV=2 [Rhizoctonia solani AG-1 IB]|uniref:Putative epoxide hydrolase n=1 Tax=Thanatephorus cucumeris (strain AG1-IB / isolate 7/3/14) TaxID=1108050 RepID=M5C966_THACB|nr:Putative epoxide hydrolase [Rhizoctonia solani AG-1 IB]CEL62090.1 Putative epoxide hydrolase OS=Stigmatella aurantiaca (strain DW4/3-1) GN=STAUR_4299 PE=3 SV=2 [Rhizoctonia solani AG-1 IB]
MRYNSTALLSLMTLPGVLGYNVKPFKIDLSSRVPHLKDLVKLTKLPEASVLGKAGAGIELAWLKDRQQEWLEEFDWEKEQSAMNKFNHSTVDIGDMTVHFIHQRSSSPDAIPLLLTHGWPGSFYEFHEVIGPLSNPGSGANLSFHVIVPSLPGFGFSSPAPPGWSLNNTASLFNTLLTEVLGYQTYAAAGGDWGTVLTWGLHNNHADHVKAVLYTGLMPQMAPTYESLISDSQFSNKVDGLSESQRQRLRNNTIFPTEGFGYFMEHSNRPATIGLALYDNPIGQLAWIGELYLYRRDPLIGIAPSTLNNNTILTSVSLYYLTQTFENTVNVYYQNQNGFSFAQRRAVNRVPMGFADYRYELTYYPEFYVQEVGNLVYHSEHERGGHFSALDSPLAYVNDLRTMMGRWYKPSDDVYFHNEL